MLSVYNILGQLVSTLVNGEEQPGDHELNFDVTRMASGVCIYRLQAGSWVKTMRSLLMK